MTNLDVLLRTALDLLLGRHVGYGLVCWRGIGGVGRSRFKKFALRLWNFVERSVSGIMFRRAVSATAELFLSWSSQVSFLPLSRHALTFNTSLQPQFRCNIVSMEVKKSIGIIGMGDMGKMYAWRLSAAGWK